MNRRPPGRTPPPSRPRHPPAADLAEVTLVQITGTDADGDALARPASWDGPGPAPSILMAPEPRGRPALAPGERVLARLRPTGPGRYEGRTVKRLADAPGRVLAVFRPPDRLVPTDRRARAEWIVPHGQAGGAEPGEIVLAEPLPHHRLGLRPARVIERLGRMGDARSVSLICITTHGIPTVFSEAAVAEAERARGVRARGARTDLRDDAAGHDRRRGRPRLRRCGVRRTGRRRAGG